MRRPSGTNDREAAALQFLNQGLTVVPYMPRLKRPVWQSYPEYSEKGTPGAARVEIEPGDLDRLAWALEVAPGMNIAVMPVAQVDADDAQAAHRAKALGVTRSGRCWIIKTRRGHRAIYRPPEGRPEIVTRTKAGGHELDLIVGTPALMPPSIHPSGTAYTWVPPNDPAHLRAADLEEPPQAVLDWWSNLCEPPKGPPLKSLRQPSGFIDALISALNPGRQQPRENRGNGWLEPFHCPYPERHPNGDAHPSFAINVQSTWFKCWGCGHAGPFTDLADRLNVPYEFVRSNGANTDRRVERVVPE